MSKLPTANFKTMDKVLHRLGFIAVRQKGSLVFYRHADGRTTTLPHHGNRDIARRAGEVLGVAGVSGNGQQELLAALSGEDRRCPPGSLAMFGLDIARASPSKRRERCSSCPRSAWDVARCRCIHWPRTHC